MPKPETKLPQSQVSPDPKMEKRSRRAFSTEYKLRIVAEADQCARGEIGQLLRRERLYSSQLNAWRRELANGGTEGLSKSTPAPKASRTAEQKRIEQLEKELTRTRQKLRVTEDCVELQKKPCRCSITRAMGAISHDGAR